MARRTGSADLPLHTGRVPAWLGQRMAVLQALKRLDDQARALERRATGPSLNAFMAVGRDRSAALDGRSVLGWEKELAKSRNARSG